MSRRSKGPYLAWVEKRRCWYIRVNEGGGRREFSTGTAVDSEAQALLGEFLAERRAGTYQGPQPAESVMICAVLADYNEERGADQSQPEVVAGRIGKLLDFFTTDMVASITSKRLKAYGEFSGVKPGTLRRELGILRAALAYAVQEQRLLRAPFVRLPEPPPGKERWLTRNEAARLLWQCRKTRSDTRLYLSLYVRLALYTGARPGAIKSLRWSQVKFEQGDFGVIDFNPPGRLQTDKGRARVPLNAKMRSILLRAKRQHGSDLGPVINRRGAILEDVGNGFKAALGRAGIQGVTLHTLRHTCGTWLAQRGVPMFQIAGWLGHSDARTTALYAHHHPAHLNQARAAMK